MERIAIYARLSNDDLNNSQSVSITNQIDYIKGYLNGHKLTSTETYIDDGYSGSNFLRPDFKRLMKDIELKTINTIVVKDLSRLGRNYIEVGRLLEETLPLLGVRVISINDNYDSRCSNDDTIAIRNFLNGLYLKECERKARLQVNRRCKSKNMTIMGNYGYKIDEVGKIVIDDEAAQVVRRIFDLYLNEGLSASKIAIRLSEEKIINPSFYRYLRLGRSSSVEGLVNSDNYDKYRWNKSTVRQIINNEEYIGVGVNRIYSRERSKHLKRVEPFIVQNTQEAIISKELYEKAKARRIKRTNITTKSDYPRFVKKVYCASCNRIAQFNIKYGKRKVFKCRTCGTIIDEPIMMKAVYADATDVISNVKKSQFKKLFREGNYNHDHARTLEDVINEKVILETKLDSLIEKKILGETTEEDFIKIKSETITKLDILNEELKAFNQNVVDDRLYNYEVFMQRINKLKDEAEFIVADTLIEKISYEITEDNKMKLNIKYNLDDR